MANLFLINFKNYRQAFEGFPGLYQDLETVAKKYPEVQTCFAPPPLLAARITDVTTIPLWAQHSDPLPLERGTGFLPVGAGKQLQLAGTLLNHSEHPLSNEDLAKAVKMSKEIGLPTVVFAASVEAILAIRELEPDYIAYEPPELVGGDISVTSARANIIPEALETAQHIPLLVGAGIHETKDIEVSSELGAIGVAISSAIVTAPKPAEVLDELLSAF
jgi:triosephosphate isomerase